MLLFDVRRMDLSKPAILRAESPVLGGGVLPMGPSFFTSILTLIAVMRADSTAAAAIAGGSVFS